MINKAYGEEFISLRDYKNESDFKSKILGKIISLDNVKSAIDRANKIRDTNEHTKRPIHNGNFKYFEDNPDLTIHEFVEKVLKDSSILV